MPLFSQTKITGSFHSEARLTDSWKFPAWTAPSPKNTRPRGRRPGAWRQSVANRHRQVAADHTGRAHETVCLVDQMHRAAQSVAEPVNATHQLCHRLRHRRSLRQCVTVSAMAAVDSVFIAQLPANGGRDTLAANERWIRPWAWTVRLSCATRSSNRRMRQIVSSRSRAVLPSSFATD